MKIYSYMECEKPVLATRLPMHTQVLDDKVAMLVKPTPLEMARGVSLLLENVGLRQRLAGAAKKKLNNEFSPKQMNLRISEFYKRLAINLGVS